MSGIGHNNGPHWQGARWRRHCWKKARADLLPTLPIEILRSRVRRAKALGLDYRTYASVRASTGRDVIGFLFSNNALRAFVDSRKIPSDREVKLQRLQGCTRIGLISRPLVPEELVAANPASLDAAYPAPDLLSNWPQARALVQAALRPGRHPADGVLLVGDATLEREWAEAGKLAGYLPADRFFTPSAQT